MITLRNPIARRRSGSCRSNDGSTLRSLEPASPTIVNQRSTAARNTRSAANCFESTDPVAASIQLHASAMSRRYVLGSGRMEERNSRLLHALDEVRVAHGPPHDEVDSSVKQRFQALEQSPECVVVLLRGEVLELDHEVEITARRIEVVTRR